MKPSDQKILVWSLCCVVFLLSLGVWGAEATDSVDKKTARVKKDPIVKMRDPFWPVGFDPRPVLIPTGINEKVAEMELRKTIRGIGTLGAGNFVMIAGGNKTVGETVTFVYGEKKYRWKIVKIAVPKEVDLQFLSAE